MSVCRVCGVELKPSVNWVTSLVKRNNRICKSCDNERCANWKHINHAKCLEYAKNYSYGRGTKPMGENKHCASYLGCHVAENILQKVFNNVIKMPNNHRFYDFICSKGKKIDVKSACISKQGGWIFTINKNMVADYFLCIAFDNRDDLNPLHLWLIPNHVLSHLKNTSISKSTIYKWDEYRIDVSKVVECCEEIRRTNNENE